MRNKRIVGLVLEDRRLSVAQVRFIRNQQRWETEKSDTKIIGEEENRTQSIQKLFEDNNISTKRVVASISGGDTIVKIISLPPVPPRDKKKIDQIMQNEILRLFPLNTNEVAFDYQILRRTRDKTLVLLSATRRNILEAHLNFLSEANISPKAIMPSSLILYNTLMLPSLVDVFDSDKTDRNLSDIVEKDVFVAVKLKESWADIVIIEDGLLKLARSFSLNAVESRSFEREIRNTLSSYKNIKKLILLTESSKLPSYIKIDALKKTLSCESCELKKVGLEPAIGLAMSYAEMPNVLRINLLRQLIQEKQKEQKEKTKQRIWNLAPAGLLLISIILSFILRQWTEQAHEKLSTENSIQQLVQKREKELVHLKKKLDILENKENAISWAEPKYDFLSYRLYQIAQATPQKVWLSRVETPMEMDKRRRKKKETIPFMSTLYVTGFSPAQPEIDSFQKRLRQQDVFSVVKQQSTEEVLVSGERILKFTLELRAKPRILESRHDTLIYK